MTFSPIKIEQLLQKAEALEKVAHAEAEAGKVGVLRGGNSGVLTDDGETYGNCARATLLRYLGVDTVPDFRSRFFFAAGYANETRWDELLKEIWPGRVLREEETPISWTLTDPGTGQEVSVTGRPDFVLTDDDGKPTVGLELKKVCSSYRAVKVFFSIEASAEHLVQAAHYSWKMGKIPWILSYTSDSSYDAPGWIWKAKRNWRVPLERKIQPGRQHFYCGWQGDVWCFIDPVDGHVVETKITSRGIENYYKYVLEMNASKQLGPRPTDLPVYSGGEDPDPCKYCPFVSACDDHEDGEFDDWVDAARVAAQRGGDDD